MLKYVYNLEDISNYIARNWIKGKVTSIDDIPLAKNHDIKLVKNDPVFVLSALHDGKLLIYIPKYDMTTICAAAILKECFIKVTINYNQYWAKLNEA